jgi:hypothetical protein
MATRSTIAYKTDRGVTAIYAHWDGYPAHNGRILEEHYQAAYKIGKLVNLGDLSVLGPEIGVQVDFDDRAAHEGQCVYYGRDRGESNTECKEFDDIPSWIEHYDGAGCEYFYLWNGKEWIVHARDNYDNDMGFPVFDLLSVKVDNELARLRAAGYDVD